MHPQLMLLLEIQDLHHQRTALLEEPAFEKVESNHFNIDSEAAAEALSKKIEELKERLNPSIRQRCERGFSSMRRMVVPVIDGVCYGCFVSIPTSRTEETNQEVEICESCGRFIYVLS